jgi:hypothetical protein
MLAAEGVQVPVTQETQAPVQAVLQQTPSTQLPNAHWLGADALQAWPFIFLARQVPPAPLQYVPDAQSMSVLQVLAQAFAEHMNGAHACALATQLPFEHWPASVSVAALWQVACEHVVPFAYFWQPPAPSHLPFVPQFGAPWSTHEPFGSTAPAIMGEHVPGIPGTLQALHDGQLGEPQQTPSTQFVEVHWSPLVQACPVAFVG